jgi:hypothetical protein
MFNYCYNELYLLSNSLKPIPTYTYENYYFIYFLSCYYFQHFIIYTHTYYQYIQPQYIYNSNSQPRNIRIFFHFHVMKLSFTIFIFSLIFVQIYFNQLILTLETTITCHSTKIFSFQSEHKNDLHFFLFSFTSILHLILFSSIFISTNIILLLLSIQIYSNTN